MRPKDENITTNVLVVDDDPAILQLFTMILEQGHHKVRTASDGNQALQMILQECPDVLMTDWMMPGIDGLELSRRVRQLHARKVLPHYSYILLMTTRSGKTSFVEGLEAGVDDFIEKTIASLPDLRVEIKARFNAALRIRRLESNLEFAAKYDYLTHLLNRIAFFDAAHELWDRSVRTKSPLAAVMLDCDFFKRVNDIHGHAAGDAVLQELAAVLRKFSRQSDILCRYGGEEFLALLPGCNEKIAFEWADRIRQQFEATPICHEALEIPITVSFGVAERADSTELLDTLIGNVDQALISAKNRGRNRVIRYTEMIGDQCSILNPCNMIDLIFEGVSVGDIMKHFQLCVRPSDSVATVVDHFLKTRYEMLPVIDKMGFIVGVVRVNDLIAIVGNHERWVAPISSWAIPNMSSYPSDTPLRVVVEFLCRVSTNYVLVTDDKMPVGFVSQIQILRWLRNRWASLNKKIFDDIIPSPTIKNVITTNLRGAIAGLIAELETLDSRFHTEEDSGEITVDDRSKLVTSVTHAEEMMEQVLKYGALSTTEPSGLVPLRQ